MIDDQIEASVIFARNIEIDAEADFNRHHRPRKAPRRVDGQAETATVFSLRGYHRNQFREVLDVLTSRMKEHLVQRQKSLLPLLKCLKPPVDGSEIHSAVSLFPPSQSPDPLAIGADSELQVLAELLYLLILIKTTTRWLKSAQPTNCPCWRRGESLYSEQWQVVNASRSISSIYIKTLIMYY